MVKRIHTVFCQVADMDRSVAFYRDVLGLKPGVVSQYWSDFDLGGSKLGLHPPLDGSEPPYGLPLKGWFLGLEVDDLPAVRAKLLDAGVWVAEDYHEIPGGVVLDFADPDGNPVQAVQVGARLGEL